MKQVKFNYTKVFADFADNATNEDNNFHALVLLKVMSGMKNPLQKALKHVIWAYGQLGPQGDTQIVPDKYIETAMKPISGIVNNPTIWREGYFINNKQLLNLIRIGLTTGYTDEQKAKADEDFEGIANAFWNYG